MRERLLAKDDGGIAFTLQSVQQRSTRDMALRIKPPHPPARSRTLGIWRRWLSFVMVCSLAVTMPIASLGDVGSLAAVAAVRGRRVGGRYWGGRGDGVGWGMQVRVPP